MRFLWKSQIEKGQKTSRKTPKKVRRPLPEASQRSPLLGLLWIFLLGTLVYVLFFSPFLLIDSVSVKGAERLEPATVESFIQAEIHGKHLSLFPKNNFLLLRPTHLAEKVAEYFPLTQTVSVTRVFPSHLELTLTERASVLLWCSGGPCYLVNEEGRTEEARRALDEANSERIIVIDTSAQPIRQGQALFDFDLPSFAAEIEPYFRDRLNLEVGREYQASSRFAHELRVKTRDGYFIYLSTELPLEKTISDLALFFEKELPAEKRQELEYIDARTENRLYYLLRGQSPVASETEAELQEQPAEKKDENTKKKKE